jgi:hypothetical protein
MSELFKEFVRIGRFVPATSSQRFAYVCSALLILSGLVHGVVYLVDGGPWNGPISWRKPIVFGLSFGITLATLAWMLQFLRPRAVVAWILTVLLALASLGEVFLITMQRWRGVASHFNETTAFDEQVFSRMGQLVALIVLLTVIIAVWALIRLDAPPSLAFAIRAGLVLMLVSQGVGVQMIVEGGNTFGDDGALKVPHAVTLHAAQVLPALALLLLLSVSAERRRVRVVALGAAGYAVLIASTMVQTYSGNAPLDLGVVSSVLALGGLTLLATSAVIALRGVADRLHPTTAPTVVTPS